MAWLGVKKADTTSTQSLVNAIFDELERRLSKPLVTELLAFILVRPNGVAESEMVDQLAQSVHSIGAATQLWCHFCWIMGPLLLHTDCTYVMDRLVLRVAEARYDTQTAHSRLRTYLEQQPTTFTDDQKRYSTVNARKYELLPTHVFATNPTAFSRSAYCTDLGWIGSKLSHCGSDALLQDLMLASGCETTEEHVTLLLRFIEANYVALNYEGQQFVPLLKECLSGTAARNAIMDEWDDEVDRISIICLQEVHVADEESDAEGGASYDSIVALGTNFVAAISTLGQELIVWDAVKLVK